jgi:hypothetical protein
MGLCGGKAIPDGPQVAIPPFKLVILKAENVRDCDTVNKYSHGDFYVVGKFYRDIPIDDPRVSKRREMKELRFRTTTVPFCKKGCPAWFHVQHVPPLPTVNTRIVLQIWDRDYGKPDDFAGEVVIPMGRPNGAVAMGGAGAGGYIPTFQMPMQVALPLKSRIDHQGQVRDYKKPITGFIRILFTRSDAAIVQLE